MNRLSLISLITLSKGSGLPARAETISPEATWMTLFLSLASPITSRRVLSSAPALSWLGIMGGSRINTATKNKAALFLAVIVSSCPWRTRIIAPASALRQTPRNTDVSSMSHFGLKEQKQPQLPVTA
jgi:hypothetical protein